MKPPILLKTILDVCFILLMISYIASFSYFLIILFLDPSLPIEINDHKIEELNLLTGIIIVANFAVSGISVYVIYLLRKLVRNFFKKKFFTRLQVSLFNLIGQLVITAIIAETILDFFSSLLLQKKLELGLKTEASFDNLFVVLAIGLFFLFLGKLFENARRLREENELTV